MIGPGASAPEALFTADPEAAVDPPGDRGWSAEEGALWRAASGCRAPMDRPPSSAKHFVPVFRLRKMPGRPLARDGPKRAVVYFDEDGA